MQVIHFGKSGVTFAAYRERRSELATVCLAHLSWCGRMKDWLPVVELRSTPGGTMIATAGDATGEHGRVKLWKWPLKP